MFCLRLSCVLKSKAQSNCGFLDGFSKEKVDLSTAMANGVVSNTLKPLTNAHAVRGRPT